jgi:hypothetical protein
VKAQFKHAFLSGLSVRGYVFAVVLMVNAAFISLGAMGLLPLAGQITVVGVSGMSIAVMMVVNVIGDIGIVRRMFSAPDAYFYALTPAPRWKTMLSSLLTMAALDIITMAVSIAGVAWLSMQLAGVSFGMSFWRAALWQGFGDVMITIWSVIIVIAGYLLIWTVILFCITVRKSLLFNAPAGGFLTAVMAAGVLYAISLTNVLLIPFGSVSRWGMSFTVTVGTAGTVAYGILIMLQAAALFYATSALMERKMNI